jgi:hypothetical protein
MSRRWPGTERERWADSIDAVVAKHRPFGDSDYLHDQLHLRYKGRLAKISEALAVAGELSRALEQVASERKYRVLGDPVVRRATDVALHLVWNGSLEGAAIAECEEVFRGTLRHLEAGHPGGPLESGGGYGRRLGTEPWHGAIWSEEHGDDVFGRFFRRVVRENFRGEPLCTPSAADLAGLARGAQLLGTLLPLCSQSVLRHTHMVVVVPHVGIWKEKASCSEFDISGTIFLNRDMLGNPWWVAEHLLHESLHQKLYDFRHTHSLMAEDLSPEARSKEDAAAVLSIWNVGGAAQSNAWDTFRAVAALHVYVHLACLCVRAAHGGASLVKRFGAPDATYPAMTEPREAFQRAHYLGRQIKASCWRELGPAGRLFVDWLVSILDAIDPAPPPPDSLYLHLLLHRYLVEATLVAKGKLTPALVGHLPTLVDEEAQVVRDVLLAVDAGGPAMDRLGNAVTRRPNDSVESAFLRFRTIVAAILQTLSPDGYGLRRASLGASTTERPEKMIQSMVDRSSQQLVPVLARSAPPSP